jgi:glycolate oxidase
MNSLSDATPKLSQAELAKLLREFMPADSVLTETESQRPFECDGLAIYTEMPLVVALPETVEQVQQIMKVCHQHHFPVVARGAGTGLSAGALPNKHGVLLSLSKLKNILEIDPLARTARLQPGVRNLAVSEAAEPYGLYYAPDPSSQIACSIGGNIAENAGGVHCLKYGLTVHNVLALELITVEGYRLQIGGSRLDSSGPDLLAVLNGSEGLLGVVTEITVKLLPRPEQVEVIMAGFDNIDQAGNAVSEVIAAGIIPGGLEMMDKLAIQAAEAFAHAGYPVDAEALLLCEVDGTTAEIEHNIATISTLFKKLGATSIQVSENANDRARMWKGRKSAFPAIGRISADYYCMDGTIPRSKIAEVLQKIHALATRHELRVANVFHAGDGNLHPLILFDSSVAGEIERAEILGGEILVACVESGGSITGEHGVGLEKIAQMHDQFSTAELTQFHALKAAFDPLGQLNPGKGIPVLKNCQEYRSLSPLGSSHSHHVHNHG